MIRKAVGVWGRSQKNKEQGEKMNKTAQAYFKLGFKLASEGEWSKAVKMISKGLKLEPNNKCAILNRCSCYAMMNKLPEALKDADRLVGIDPNDNAGYLLVGNVMAEMGFHLHAIETFDKSIAIQPNDPAAYVGRGNVKMEQGKADQAFNDYVHALTLNPTLFEALIGLARSLRALDRPNRAVEAYEKLLSMIGDQPHPIALDARAELKEVKKQLRGGKRS